MMMNTPAGPATPTSNLSSFEVVDIDGATSNSNVAIVGLSCRTAGGINTPDQLWSFLLDKKHASGEIPPQRWEPWLQRDSRNAQILQNIIRKGYFLDNVEGFDAAFFGISPKEAELMDPHQRLGLELAWEALENAGINPKGLAGSDTAVYMGVDSDDYSRILLEDLPNIEAWSGIGSAYCGIPNRISYHLDLKGPSTAVDAACASSLIAIHLAYQAITSGESSTAICGGVNVICAPGLTHMLQKAGALSSDGMCRSFDDQACGYARGEGGAIVVLKKLSAALADNDNILAIMKGTASAQDGKTNGIMAPNVEAQELVARKALSRAGNMDPMTIRYVEAHATSTSLGDPTEISAIAKVYGAGRTGDNVCFVGSIKPNIGHLEAAAGAIGFLKAVLAVRKAELAPQTLLGTLNTKIDWDNSGLRVLREKRTWPQADSPRRAAICCYGYGGSVCNAIIEQAPTTNTSIQDPEQIINKKSVVTLVLSAHQERRLSGHAASLAKWLSTEGKSEDLRAIARTLSQRRAAHDYRAAFVVADREDAVQVLTSFANSEPTQWTVSHRSLGKDINKDAVWVFSGHGAQWLDMGKELVIDSIFREAIVPLDGVVQNEMNFSALKALELGDFEGSQKVQVLTYVVQIGLSEVLKSKGIHPQAIIGHSVGEIAASVAAGCLTAAEGTLIVSRRAKLYAQLQGQGAMVMVNLPFCQVMEELGEGRGVVAAINSSPTSCVISGDASSVEAYVGSVEKRGIQTWKVKTDGMAYHSPSLESLVAPLQHNLEGALSPRPATIPLYSTSNPNPRTTALRDETYWSQNMVAPVKLVEAIEAAVKDGFRIFLEVSSHPIISHSISEILTALYISEFAVVGVMKRDTPPTRSILRAIAHLHTLGVHVDFNAQLGVSPWSSTVPNTPWVHKSFWKKYSPTSSSVTQQHDVDRHTLLGGVMEIAGSGIKAWTTILDENTKPYPLIHPLDGTEIVPAAVYCNTFLKATNATMLKNIKLRVPLAMTADQREVQVIVQDSTVRLFSRLRAPNKTLGGDVVEHTWIEHSTATFEPADVHTYQHTYSLHDIKNRIQRQLPKDFAWTYLQKIGVSGIAFPWAVLEHHGNEAEMLVRMDMCPGSTDVTWDKTSWASFLDAATSVGSSIFFKSVRMRIVSGIDQVFIVSHDRPPKAGWLFIRQCSEGKQLKADISILDESGTSLVELKGMRFSDVEALNDRSSGVDKLVHRLAWVPPLFSEMPLSVRSVVLVSIDNQLATRYARTLKSVAQNVFMVSSSEDLTQNDLLKVLEERNTLVIYVPEAVERMDDVGHKAQDFVWQATRILKTLAMFPSLPKLFLITMSHQLGQIPTVLAHASLFGFARIAASEYSALWGGLVDSEEPTFPLLALRYVQGQSVIRMQDGLPRVPRLRPFSKSHQHKQANRSIMPKPHGTYLVTGGFGDLGLHLLEFLVQKSARRIIVVSRRPLPPRKLWSTATNQMGKVVQKIAELEAMGATIHAIALDIGSPSALVKLSERVDALDLPPVLGVIHAAGVSGYSYIKDTTSKSFAEVMAPKIHGALNLHAAFPPNTLDFFVLFSSIGQLIGTPGQAAYAASNAFLDALATHRHLQGCNAVSIQWTAWRGMGLAANTELVDLELEAKGVTDISVNEGFEAWEYLSRYETDHAVVTRTRVLDPGESLPCALVADIVQRRTQPTTSSTSEPLDTSPAELKTYLSRKVRQCLSTLLHLGNEEIDDKAAIADLGVDSVMTVALRQQLQKEIGVTVPPTLTWSCPTVEHLIEWFYGEVARH